MAKTVLLNFFVLLAAAIFLGMQVPPAAALDFPVVDSMQETCWNNSSNITCPSSGENFYGQDAQFDGLQFSYADNGNGTVSDQNTGLVWQQSADTNGDGEIDTNDKMLKPAASSYCEALSLGDQEDWRLPSIKELYSLFDARGTDASESTEDLTPYIDTDYFTFAYGDTSAGERTIDAQYASSTDYVGSDSSFGDLTFGVNFADGRIKGYPSDSKTFYVKCVRGTSIGTNSFTDNGDGTVSDQATSLMWSQDDSAEGLNWRQALAWVQEKNSAQYLGYDDWRLPNTKELQSIVDYARSPDTTSSPAIDAVFNTTQITNEAGAADYPYFWTSTTHKSSSTIGASADYVAFGRALGYMDGSWTNVHGAGCQRSDYKEGDPSEYPEGHGPQGDAVRIYNYVRLVRDVSAAENQADIWWRNTSTGENLVWFMNGTAKTSEETLSVNVDSSWDLGCLADFNSDGETDALWHEQSGGQTVIHYFSDTTYVGQTSTLTIPAPWSVGGCADFDADGQTDIYWYNPNTGRNGVTYLQSDGTRKGDYGFLSESSTVWLPRGAADFNGDSKPDMLYRNSNSGHVAILLLDNLEIQGIVSVATIATEWDIHGLGDFDADSMTDLLWRNDTTGQNGVLYMNQTASNGNTLIDTVTPDSGWDIGGAGVFH